MQTQTSDLTEAALLSLKGGDNLVKRSQDSPLQRRDRLGKAQQVASGHVARRSGAGI